MAIFTLSPQPKIYCRTWEGRNRLGWIFGVYLSAFRHRLTTIMVPMAKCREINAEYSSTITPLSSLCLKKKFKSTKEYFGPCAKAESIWNPEVQVFPWNNCGPFFLNCSIVGRCAESEFQLSYNVRHVLHIGNGKKSRKNHVFVAVFDVMPVPDIIEKLKFGLSTPNR